MKLCMSLNFHKFDTNVFSCFVIHSQRSEKRDLLAIPRSYFSIGKCVYALTTYGEISLQRNTFVPFVTDREAFILNVIVLLSKNIIQKPRPCVHGA